MAASAVTNIRKSVMPPHSGAARNLLSSWRNTKRFLSQLLIVIIATLSPLTFSNDDIPNFEPRCETRSLTTKSVDVTVTLCYPPTPVANKDPKPLSEPRYASLSAVLPTVLHIFPVYPSRAPPL